MEKRVIFCIMLISCIIGKLSAQCIAGNDIKFDETNIETALDNFAEGSVQFSLNLLRTLHEEQKEAKNLKGMFCSPHSIWSALMLTYMGSRGATALEMKNVLGLGNVDKVDVWEAFNVIRNWNNYQTSVHSEQLFEGLNHLILNTANRLYFQEGTAFKKCMREMLEKDIAFLDFENSPSESIEEINRWVEEKTHQRIKDLIPSKGIGQMTKMLIVNAIYFKESWQQPFKAEKTARRRFTLPTRKHIFVSMMNTKGKFRYGRSEELQCYGLELPYAGNTLTMTILLPSNRYYGFDILVSRLTSERLLNLYMDMDVREVNVSIPKVQMEDSFELSSILTKMGLRNLFNPKRVDLSGFTGYKEFAVDSFHHKTFIDINEEGTEAAGATTFFSSRNWRPVEPATFYADSPFVYFIRENLANVVLFMGTVLKPSEYGTL